MNIEVKSSAASERIDVAPDSQEPYLASCSRGCYQELSNGLENLVRGNPPRLHRVHRMLYRSGDREVYTGYTGLSLAVYTGPEEQAQGL